MGRSKLLQRKLENSFGQEEGTAEVYSKLFRDIDLISRDTDRLSELLQNVAEKFYTFSKTTTQRINLSELIGIELSFFEFYLDFKHNVKKTVHLKPDLPEIVGVPADFSLSFWALMRRAMVSMKECENKEIFIATDHDGDYLQVQIADTGKLIDPENQSLISSLLAGDILTISDDDPHISLIRPLFMLKKYHARFRLERRGEANSVSIFIPIEENRGLY